MKKRIKHWLPVVVVFLGLLFMILTAIFSQKYFVYSFAFSFFISLPFAVTLGIRYTEAEKREKK